MLGSFAFGASILAVAISPSLPVAVVVMLVVGAFSIVFTSLTNTILQLESEPHLRSRVMALWTVAFLGSTPVGAPLIALVAEHAGPRIALAVGGTAAVVAGLLGIAALRHRRAEEAREEARAVCGPGEPCEDNPG